MAITPYAGASSVQYQWNGMNAYICLCATSRLLLGSKLCIACQLCMVRQPHVASHQELGPSKTVLQGEG